MQHLNIDISNIETIETSLCKQASHSAFFHSFSYHHSVSNKKSRLINKNSLLITSLYWKLSLGSGELRKIYDATSPQGACFLEFSSSCFIKCYIFLKKVGFLVFTYSLLMHLGITIFLKEINQGLFFFSEKK